MSRWYTYSYAALNSAQGIRFSQFAQIARKARGPTMHLQYFLHVDVSHDRFRARHGARASHSSALACGFAGETIDAVASSMNDPAWEEILDGGARDAGGTVEVVGCVDALATSCRAPPQNPETVEGIPHAVALAF